ncbi:MAG: hypothetical protein ACI8WB_002936 [Phenylobacterium sp.]|jgi:hypothetical protein
MALDLKAAQSSTPNEALVTEPEPLTGKEKAGVSLTWGIIAVLVCFLIVLLSIFVWGELKFFNAYEQITNLKDGTEKALADIDILTAALKAKQTSFRTFWFDILQLILLNVLFPTLTALLGYVFGTSKANKP